MASELKVDKIFNAGGDQDSGINLATNDTIKFDIATSTKATMASTGIVTIVGEGGTTTTNLQQGLAKGWVNFTGEGTVAINDSHAVSSITDDAVGKYTVNFTNAMGNTNYAVTAQTEDGGGFNDPRIINHDASQARTTAAYGLYHWHISSEALNDATKLNVIAHGDLA